MNHPRLKITRSTIINLWFGADTPLRHYKIKHNPDLWRACQRTSLTFSPPSGAQSLEEYRKSDQRYFAQAVEQALASNQ